SRPLAAEVGTTTSIRVNSLNPGGTRTAMRAAAYPGENPDTLPTPESLMPVYLYLLGPDGRDLHGQTLDVRDFNPAGN
ncbi:MAG: YciK family oxidoreductase, partial [Gammaproteobacteria bacterium]|nr:YciK family oxidoreductase [Gammaproteobacteria bacterium]